jgi:hypothetical protein
LKRAKKNADKTPTVLVGEFEQLNRLKEKEKMPDKPKTPTKTAYPLPESRGGVGGVGTSAYLGFLSFIYYQSKTYDQKKRRQAVSANYGVFDVFHPA